MRRALIAGGAGFVGSHLCERFLAEGWHVVCLDNFLTSGPGNVEHLVEHERFTLLVQDVTHSLDLPGPLDVVLHLASPASPCDCRVHPVETLTAGSFGTMNLLELARDRSARFVLASSWETPQEPSRETPQEPSRETPQERGTRPCAELRGNDVEAVGPRSCYDEARRFSEAVTTAYQRTYGVDTAIMRILDTYGPRMRVGDGWAIPALVGDALAGLPLTVGGDGSRTRSVCYVEDLVDAVLRLALSRVAGPVDLGNPREISLLDLALRIRRLCGSRSEIVFVDRPEEERGGRSPDFTVARDQLGWSPRTDPDEGLRRTVAWFARDAARRCSHPPLCEVARSAVSGVAVG